MEPSLPLQSPFHHQENQCPAMTIPRSKNSSSQNARLDQSNRGESIFPETERQLETIFRKASEGWQNVGKASPSKPQVIIDQSELIILEDRSTVMQKRNVALITENESLRSQAKTLLDKIRKLEESFSKNSSGIAVISIDEDAIGTKKIKQQFEDRGVSPIDFMEKTMDRGVQVSTDPVCPLCQQMFQPSESTEPTAIITRSELDILTNDMQRLKVAVAGRECDLERAIERENNYRVQLKRLAAENIVARQLSDSRHAELERLAETLTETERELKLAQKEVYTLKKSIRQDKRHRELAEGKCTNDEASHNKV